MISLTLVSGCCLIAMTAFALAGESPVALPPPRPDGDVSVEHALRARRSVREYKSEALTMEAVSQVLWAAQGITAPDGLRTAPSAGALYPLEVYLVATDIVGLQKGVYKYAPRRHALIPVLQGERRAALAKAALGQECIEHAPAALVIAAVYARTAKKYGSRAERYAHIEVGHAAQNVYLQAGVLGIGTVIVGAFDDKAVARALEMPKAEAPLAVMPLGKR